MSSVDVPVRTRRSRPGALLAVLVVGIVLAAVVWVQLGYVVNAQDEGQLLVYPGLLAHGLVPNRDFQSVYGAGHLAVLAGVYALAGTTLVVERLVAATYWALICGALGVLVGRRHGVLTGLIGSLSSLLVLAVGPQLSAFAYVAAMAFAALGFLLLDLAERRPLLALGTGFCWGMVVSSRLELGVGIAAALLPLLFCRRRQVALMLPGLVVGVVPVVWNAVVAGPHAVVYWQVLQPVLETGPGRVLPWSALSTNTHLALGGIALAGLVCVVGGILRWRAGLGPNAFALALFALTTIPQAYQRADTVHLGYVLCFLFPAALANLPAVRRGLAPVVAILLGLPFLRLFLHAGIPMVREVAHPYPTAFVSSQGRSIRVSALQRHDLQSLVDRADASMRPGDSLFVGPRDLRRTNLTDTYLYYLFPRQTTGSFFLEMDPAAANAVGSPLARQLAHTRWLVLTTEFDQWNEPNASRDYGPSAPNVVVRQDFRRVGTFGPWTLWRNRH